MYQTYSVLCFNSSFKVISSLLLWLVKCFLRIFISCWGLNEKNTEDATWVGKLYFSSFKPNSTSFCWNHELTTFFMKADTCEHSPEASFSKIWWRMKQQGLLNRWTDRTTPKCKWELLGCCKEFFSLAALFVWDFFLLQENWWGSFLQLVQTLHGKEISLALI